MKLAIISDLHGNLPDYYEAFEDVELLLICGDLIPLDIQGNILESKKWFLNKFKPWVYSLSVKKCYFIAGNHDFLAERNPDWMKEHFPITIKVSYLCNETATYFYKDKTYKIFGTPYCHLFGNWPFMRDYPTLEKYYSLIPNNCDIVISHDAPALAGLGTIHQGDRQGTEAGNYLLSDYILQKKPKYFFGGHIHSGEHSLQEYEGIKLANTSIVDENYNLTYNPLIIDIE